MAKNFKNKKKWHKLGGIWKNEYKNDDGSVVTKLSIGLDLAAPAVLKIKRGDAVYDVHLIPNEKNKVYLQLQKPEDEIASLLANGIIDESTAEKRKAELPETLRYNVVLPPPRD